MTINHVGRDFYLSPGHCGKTSDCYGHKRPLEKTIHRISPSLICVKEVGSSSGMTCQKSYQNHRRISVPFFAKAFAVSLHKN
jgi:hypothetical protein